MQIQESFRSESTACLYVCSTPIGNLQDVSLRLLQVLREADVIAAEDTRQTRKLLTHFQIHPELLTSYHQHNEKSKEHDLVQWWREGKSVALVSDAGTPGVSDPGFIAVQKAVELEIPVIPIPGPSAAVTALVGSGLRPQPFLFIGFLPRGKREKRQLLENYQSLDATLIIYESPHRIDSSFSDLEELFPAREFVLAKELTKKFEGFARGTGVEIKEYLRDHAPKGEYVILVGPPGVTEKRAAQAAEQQQFEDTWEQALALVTERVEAGMSHKEAVERTAEELQIKKRQLYQATLS